MDELFTAVEAAAYLKLSRRSFDRLAVPRIQLTPRSPRWRRSDLDTYVATKASATSTTAKLKAGAGDPWADFRRKR